MIMPDSFIVNGGLAPINEFSLEDARAEFKHTWNASVKHFNSVSGCFDEADGPTNGKLNTKSFAKMMSMALYVEGVLCTLASHVREMSQRIENAKKDGNIKLAVELEHDLVYGLVPYVRAVLVTAMTNLDASDMNDIRSAWDCLILAEQARRATEA